jgi:hypothetical protein
MKSSCSRYREALCLEVCGALEPEQRPALEAHLQQCQKCRIEKKKLQAAYRLAAQTPPAPKLSAEATRRMARDITRRLQDQSASASHRRLSGAYRRWVPLLAAACLLLAVFGWLELSGHAPGGDPGGPLNASQSLSQEERMLLKDLKVIRNLEMLEQMDSLQKLVHVIDQPEPAHPDYSLRRHDRIASSRGDIEHDLASV